MKSILPLRLVTGDKVILSVETEGELELVENMLKMARETSTEELDSLASKLENAATKEASDRYKRKWLGFPDGLSLHKVDNLTSSDPILPERVFAIGGNNPDGKFRCGPFGQVGDALDEEGRSGEFIYEARADGKQTKLYAWKETGWCWVLGDDSSEDKPPSLEEVREATAGIHAGKKKDKLPEFLISEDMVDDLQDLLSDLSANFYDDPNGAWGYECPSCLAKSTDGHSSPPHKHDCEIVRLRNLLADLLQEKRLANLLQEER